MGDIVSAGQEIAKVGMTGFTYLPHLHFQVFVFTGPNLWEDYQTLKVDFQECANGRGTSMYRLTK